jgi:predicted aspartyl protease
MSASFAPNGRPVVVEGWVTGPDRTFKVKLVVDTGATGTLIGASILTALGVPFPPTARRRRLRAATGGATAPVVSVRQLLVLGQAKTDFPVAAHDLPPAVTYDGLLGLDFFRGLVLTLDFARGFVALRSPRRWWLWR